MRLDSNTCGIIPRDSDSPHSSDFDRYWEPPTYVCIVCGEVEHNNPLRHAYDEFLCQDCQEKEDEADAAQDYLNHMQEQSERK